MTRSGEAAAAALVVAGLLLTTACDSDEPPTALPTATASSTPTEVSPTAPTPAKTPAGAEAFTRYFWNTINYAYKTNDTTLLRGATTDACDFCKETIDDVDSLRTEGGHYEGSLLTLKTLRSSPAISDGVYVVTTTLTQDSGKLLDAQGKTTQTFPGSPVAAWDSRIEWRSEQWVIVGTARSQLRAS